MIFDIETIIRPNIKTLSPYTTARHEFTGDAEVFLDANENPFGTFREKENVPLWMQGLNRYPDPLQYKIKEKLSTIKGVPPQNIFLGNGSDEAIDVLIRIFVEPKTDHIILCTPTYGMYKICAAIHDAGIKEIALTPSFQPDLEQLLKAIDQNTKIIFICSPNNPTGNSADGYIIEYLLQNFNGLVVVDEAYINYSTKPSWIKALTEYGNLVILQTLSKAWGLAGLRLGMAFAGKSIIDYMNKVKYPYNINEASQQMALEALDNVTNINRQTIALIEERKKVVTALQEIKICNKVYESDANFLLVNFTNAATLYQYLCSKGIIVRDRSKIKQIEDCLRITIGTTPENEKLIFAINQFNNLQYE